LLQDLPPAVRPGRRLLRIGAQLDKFYIPTRYPNSFDWGAPMDYFGEEDARKAIEYAETILEYAKRKIAG
jgi:HEPN domain-containing protein